jgi:sec-independent protein translocase protein TatA
MGSLSIWHWLIVGGVFLVLFGGKGKISDIMGDVAKGIKSFKKGMAEDDSKTEAPGAGEPAVRSLDHQASDPVKVSETRKVS